MRVSIIGAGAMGGAIARGLLKAGHESGDILVTNPHEDKLKELASLGMKTSTVNLDALNFKPDVLIVAVKPWVLKDVAGELHAPLEDATLALAVVAASVTQDAVMEMFEYNVSLVMPNTAVSLCQSMTFIVPPGVDPAGKKVIDLFAHLGDVKVIEEKLFPAATALASCGIAYALRYIRAATEGGVELGFRAADAQAIVAQTVKGAAALLDAEGAHAETEIDKVTTPGGLTIRGLNAMEREGFTNAVISGLKASKL